MIAWGKIYDEHAGTHTPRPKAKRRGNEIISLSLGFSKYPEEAPAPRDFKYDTQDLKMSRQSCDYDRLVCEKCGAENIEKNAEKCTKCKNTELVKRFRYKYRGQQGTFNLDEEWEKRGYDEGGSSYVTPAMITMYTEAEKERVGK